VAIDAETIKEGEAAARTAADPRIFPALVAAVAMAGMGMLMYWQRQDVTAERDAFIAALRENTAAIKELASELHAERRR
jgi:hypothetical protein